MQRNTPETSIMETYKVQGLAKLSPKQKGILAEKELEAADVFSVPCVQFGKDIQKQASAIMAKFVSELTRVQIENGMPEEVAVANGKQVLDSISLYSGMSEATKAYGVKAHGLPTDFWGSDGTTATAKDATPVAVSIKLK